MRPVGHAKATNVLGITHPALFPSLMAFLGPALVRRPTGGREPQDQQNADALLVREWLWQVPRPETSKEAALWHGGSSRAVGGNAGTSLTPWALS